MDMKWFRTDKILRRYGYGTPENVLDEVEPNTVFSLLWSSSSLGSSPFQTKGWRICVQDLNAPREKKTQRVFKTLKAAKAYVEREHQTGTEE